MMLEKADVMALRVAEEAGKLVSEEQLAAAGLERSEYQERINRLEKSGVIRCFKVVGAAPPLLGGDWVMGALMASAAQPVAAADALRRRLLFVTEILINCGVPAGLGPNLGMLFYSRDFETEARFIQDMSEFDYREVSRVADYSFPVAVPISADEKQLVHFLLANPGSDIAELSAGIGRDPVWLRVKLDRLLCGEHNPAGILRVQPEIDWSGVENFGHFHFLLETGHLPDQLRQLLAGTEFSLVRDGFPYRGRFVQVEADVWGTADLMEKIGSLERITGIRVAGVLWNREWTICDDWVKRIFV
ncbi:MAG: hypothetical protein ABIK43_02510 [candidate division WOR-3 bacterium]